MIGYVFLGCGTVFLIVAAFIFFSAIGTMYQIPFIGQEFNPVPLAACVPFLLLAAITYVIGGVSYSVGRVNPATPLVTSRKPEVTPDNMLDKLKRLKGIDDDNLTVIARNLDEITEKQNIVSQRH